VNSNTPQSTLQKFFVGAAFIGIAGWVFIMALLGFWYLVPVNLPTVTEPMPILNPGNRIAIGEPIVLQLDVVKKTPTEVNAYSRFLTCTSGNLVTLTGSPTNLPVGKYTVINDSAILPAKVSPGEVCTFNIRVSYRINPVRTEVLNLESEPFTVMQKKE
jgi:hypothetical protein